jgi:hypothetical protein
LQLADTESPTLRAHGIRWIPRMKSRIEFARAHSIATRARSSVFVFPPKWQQNSGAVHPLVRSLPGSGRLVVYLASHATASKAWEA